MASAISANKAELIAIANSVASEKMIDKAIVIEAMEEAIQKSARNRYGAENDIRAKLDPQTGDLRLWRVVEVVEEVEDYFNQVDLDQVQKLDANAKLGDFIVDPLPPVDLGRIDAQSAKQVIFQKVRDAERERHLLRAVALVERRAAVNVGDAAWEALLELLDGLGQQPVDLVNGRHEGGEGLAAAGAARRAERGQHVAAVAAREQRIDQQSARSALQNLLRHRYDAQVRLLR